MLLRFILSCSRRPERGRIATPVCALARNDRSGKLCNGAHCAPLPQRLRVGGRQSAVPTGIVSVFQFAELENSTILHSSFFIFHSKKGRCLSAAALFGFSIYDLDADANAFALGNGLHDRADFLGDPAAAADAAELDKLKASHAKNALKQIGAKCDPALDPNCK